MGVIVRPFTFASLLLTTLVVCSSGAQADDAFKPIQDTAGKFPAGTATVYAIASVPIAATPGGAPIGTLSPTSEVKVLGTEGDQLKVRISGWQQSSGARLVFFAPGRRILVAQMKPEEKGRLTRGKTQTDPATEQEWAEVSLEGDVPRNQFIASVDPLWKYGDSLVNANCTSCHPRPDLDHFTANQWAGIVRSKRSRVSADAEQLAMITEYTQKHASDKAGK